MEGRYLNVNNQNGSDASLTRTVSPGTTEDFIFGNLGSVAGERDTYFHANLIHDHVKSIDNSFTGGDYIMPAKVNIGSEDSYSYSAPTRVFPFGGSPSSPDLSSVFMILMTAFNFKTTTFQSFCNMIF